MSVHDIISEQDEYKAYCQEFTLWPRKWQEYDDSWNLTWHIHRLNSNERLNIPSKAGIYTLLVQPGVADHPACSYLMYIGKTKSLRRRFGEYLNQEKKETGRPKIFRLLHKYSEHVWFCFSIVAEQELTEIEEALLTAFIPPANDQLPAQINRVTGAF
jgi:hypothetical protein